MRDYAIVSLFCEDVRREMNGQETIVGTISDTMNVTAIPGAMPKLAVYIRANFDTTFDLKKLSWTLFDPEGNECATSAVDEKIIIQGLESVKEKNLPLFGIKSVMMISPLNIPSEGRFELKTTVNEETFVTGFLNVAAVQSTASEDGD